MNLFYKISIDRVNASYISGWCFNRCNKQRIVQLELYRNGVLLGEMTAELFREDLLELGIHPTGKCGFELILNHLSNSRESGNLLLVDKKNNKLLVEIDGDNYTVLKSARFLPDFRDIFSFGRKKKAIVLFMHIPKTAGTSFNTLIRSLCPNERAVSHIEATGEDNFPVLKKQYSFISGHLRYGVFSKYFQDDNTALYTIVREPYSHLHSHLKWMIRSTAEEGPGNSLKFRNPTIYHLGKELGNIDFNNFATVGKFVAEIRGVDAAFFDNLQTRHFLNGQVDRVSESDLQQAVANTSHFKLIGLTEKYNDFVDKFSDLNGLKKPGRLSKLNKSNSKALFDINDPSLREVLLPLVCHDLKLYEHIRSTFDL